MELADKWFYLISIILSLSMVGEVFGDISSIIRIILCLMGNFIHSTCNLLFTPNYCDLNTILTVLIPENKSPHIHSTLFAVPFSYPQTILAKLCNNLTICRTKL